MLGSPSRTLLKSLDGWNSLEVTYEQPRVERLWRQDGDYRIYLHRIHPCIVEQPNEEDREQLLTIQDDSQAFWHAHPWPSAMVVVSGSYKMLVGTKNHVCATLTLPRGTCYEMTDPKAYHKVCPQREPSLSIMVTGPLYQKPWWKSLLPQHKHHHGSQMPQEKAQELLSAFQYALSHSWNSLHPNPKHRSTILR